MCRLCLSFTRFSATSKRRERSVGYQEGLRRPWPLEVSDDSVARRSIYQVMIDLEVRNQKSYCSGYSAVDRGSRLRVVAIVRLELESPDSGTSKV